MRVESLLDDDRVFEPERKVLVLRGSGKQERSEGTPARNAGPPGEDSVIEFSRKQHGRLIVKLRGVNSIAEVEPLVGAELAVFEKDLPPVEEGSFYTFQLKGCQVVAPDGETLGTVTGVLDSGGTPILQVEGNDGEILIPFALSFLRKVDLEQRRIEMSLPDGLRDLNK
jgi:16S rRNA processing protein RimM